MFQSLVSGQGCSVDGTTGTINPLSDLTHRMMFGQPPIQAPQMHSQSTFQAQPFQQQQFNPFRQAEIDLDLNQIWNQSMQQRHMPPQMLPHPQMHQRPMPMQRHIPMHPHAPPPHFVPHIVPHATFPHFVPQRPMPQQMPQHQHATLPQPQIHQITKNCDESKVDIQKAYLYEEPSAGTDAFMEACFRGDLKTVSELLSVYIKKQKTLNNGLVNAFAGKHNDIIIFLIKQGAGENISINIKKDGKVVYKYKEEKAYASEEKKDMPEVIIKKDGTSIFTDIEQSLHYAVMKDDIDYLIETVMTNNVNIEVLNGMLNAICINSLMDDSKLDINKVCQFVNILIEKGATKTFDVLWNLSSSVTGYREFDWKTTCDHNKVIQLMNIIIKRTTNIHKILQNVVFGNSNIPCNKINYDIVDIFVKHGADVGRLVSPIHKEGYDKYLKQKDLNYMDFETDWSESIRNGDIDSVKKIIKNCDLNLYDFDLGLQKACLNGHINIVELMLYHCATRFDLGLDSACIGGHPQIAELMLSRAKFESRVLNKILKSTIVITQFSNKGVNYDIIHLLIKNGADPDIIPVYVLNAKKEYELYYT